MSQKQFAYLMRAYEQSHRKRIDDFYTRIGGEQ